MFPQPADCVQWPRDQAGRGTSRQIILSLSIFGDHRLIHVTFFSPRISSTASDSDNKLLTFPCLNARSPLWKVSLRGYMNLGEEKRWVRGFRGETAGQRLGLWLGNFKASHLTPAHPLQLWLPEVTQAYQELESCRFFQPFIYCFTIYSTNIC